MITAAAQDMATNLSSSSSVRLVLVSTGPNAHLAAGLLARHLGEAPEAALARLAHAPSVLAEAVEPHLAQNLAGLLRSFGLRVRLDALHGPETPVNLSIQISIPVRMQRTIRIVAEQTGLSETETTQTLQRPGGVVLTGLSRAEAARIRAKLDRVGTLIVIESDPASTVYDVFLPDRDPSEALTDRLRMMGAEPDPITNAIAAGLDGALCDHLLRRLPDAGILVLDRAFQRYDLYLSRATGWVTQDLADFLVARTGLPRSRFEVLSERLPLRIELGLAPAAARQFRADYASIGLHTFLVLSGLAQTLDNPNL
ncbi:hypothetical protein HYN69_17695 [Gemmobacter aquarius]|uniref:Uncharacterized protein n=2 Tax=Paragemmobacter aquarius TaxID=2169400 RepID=A0A2S0UQK6_9RHOB|nr:hypothetical protein HYN69_17695 [Gemmobacter aquarius]